MSKFVDGTYDILDEAMSQCVDRAAVFIVEDDTGKCMERSTDDFGEANQSEFRKNTLASYLASYAMKNMGKVRRFCIAYQIFTPPSDTIGEFLIPEKGEDGGPWVRKVECLMVDFKHHLLELHRMDLTGDDIYRLQGDWALPDGHPAKHFLDIVAPMATDDVVPTDDAAVEELHITGKEME